METLITAIIFMLLGSGFFSATEAAFFSTTLNKAKIFATQKKKGAQYLLKIKKDMRPTITVLVIFTNIFNIAGSILIGALAGNIFGSTVMGLFSAILTFLVIIFAEIIPKSIGEAYANFISIKLAKTFFYTTKMLHPFIVFIELFTKPIPKKKKTVSEEEIRSLSNIGFLEGAIEKDEREMIHRVFLLNDLKVEDIMTPRTVITAFQSNKTLKDLESEIFSLTHSRIPVYNKDLDNIIGICHQRDLLIALSKKKKKEKIINFISKDITTVNKNQKIDELIPIFRKMRCHLAIVVDDFGGTAGVISLEDVLEQLIGSVVDETDKTEDLRKEAKKNLK